MGCDRIDQDVQRNAEEQARDARRNAEEGARGAEERVREARRRAREAAREAFREEWRHRRSAHRQRKGRVLHTRISEDLSEDIRRLADDLRVPVSNLVRNVLEEAFGMVERVSDDVGDILEDVLEEAEGARDRIRRRVQQRRGTQHGRRRRWASPASDDEVEEELSRDEQTESEPGEGSRVPREFPDVVGWQPLVLNRPQACADCGVQLQKGERAFLGVKTGGISDTALCANCVRGM